jgi:hypothetical protein
MEEFFDSIVESIFIRRFLYENVSKFKGKNLSRKLLAETEIYQIGL